MDQGFEGMNYFRSMRLHKEAFGAIVQANVESFTENFKNIGAVESSKQANRITKINNWY